MREMLEGGKQAFEVSSKKGVPGSHAFRYGSPFRIHRGIDWKMEAGS